MTDLTKDRQASNEFSATKFELTLGFDEAAVFNANTFYNFLVAHSVVLTFTGEAM